MRACARKFGGSYQGTPSGVPESGHKESRALAPEGRNVSSFVHAAHAGWWILAGCGYVVLLLGVLCTTQWAKATASRLG